MRYSFEQLRQLLLRNGGAALGDTVVNILAAIGVAESGGDSSVRRYCPLDGYCYITRAGRTYREREYPNQGAEDSIGLWQINRNAWGGTPSTLSNPDKNAQIAIQAYLQQGFNAWKNTYQSGKYKRYLQPNAAPNFPAYSAPNAVAFDNTFDSNAVVLGERNRYLIAVVVLVIIFIFAFN